ncbi:MAG TPA: hypothetical protein VG817_10640 [Gemmatimonadales bacterium]|nr:hypothetical protein [Gemmatimonadales bacterium]
MASGLKWWVGGTVLACVIIAVAYLPARGLSAYPDFIGMGMGNRYGQERSDIAERRAMLANQYAVVDARIQAARMRREAEPVLEAQRAAGTGPHAAVFAPDSTMELRRRLMIPGFDSAWKQLGLDDAKVAVVLASPDRGVRGKDVPPPQNWLKAYILPDSTDRTTCVVVYPSATLGDERPRQNVVNQRMRTGLGPCAFYARFGVPSPRVRRWLQANSFDVAESSDWSGMQRFRDSRYGFDIDVDQFRSYFGVGTIWYYTSIYQLSFNTVACLAGRPKACLDGVRKGDGEGSVPIQRVVTPGERWRVSEQRLPEQAELLAEIYREVGENAFQEFWTTSLPIDSALSIALEQPVGDWLVKRKVPDRDLIQLGPIPPWPGIVFAVGVAAALMLAALVAVQYRQVR